MKTTMIMRKKFVLVMMTLLPALLSAAQAQAVDYKNTYKGVRYERPYQQVEYKVATTATAPMAGFQSTSAYSGKFGSEEQPMLNSDGTVNEEAYMAAPEHPRRIRMDEREDGEGNTGTPGQTGDKQPLGDAVLPLLLLAGVYLSVRVFLRRKRA